MQVFEDDDKGLGCHMTEESLAYSIAILQATQRGSRVLLGQISLFSPGSLEVDWSETNRARALQALAGHYGLTVDGPRQWYQWIDIIRDRVDRIYLPYHLHDDHYVVFEITLSSGRGQYVKIWDGNKTWQRIEDASQLLEVKTIIDVFFKGRVVDILLWEPGDPTQERGQGDAAFAFMLLCHLVQGKTPSAWTQDDEAVARSFMWGCIRHGKILPLPEQRVKPIVSV